MDGYKLIAEEATQLAKLLPPSVIESVAVLLKRADVLDRGNLRARVGELVPGPRHRAVVIDFLDQWQSRAECVPQQAVAAALFVAGLSESERRESQSIELVWTGPDVGVVPLRRTEQVVLQVIEESSKRLLVVSYAVYNIPRIGEALVRAADRGVVINIVVESPDRNEGKKAYSSLAALGSSVASRCGVFLWPIEHRLKGASDRPGLLHVKCAVADSRRLFLSSANLTEYAFSINMELGVLITGGSLPTQVQSHFSQMIQSGLLVKS